MKGAFGSAVLAAVLATAGTMAPTVGAWDDKNEVSAADVELALSGAASPLVEPAVESRSSPTNAAVAATGDATIAIPRDPTDGVQLAIGGTAVLIGLPAVEDASTAVSLDSGAIAYPDDGGSANSVIPLAEGVQMLTTISSTDAPTSFAYDVMIPEHASMTLAADGSAIIADDAGNVILSTSAPWAVDANGAAVPTRYELQGNRLTQVVEHRLGGFAYPIVADPTWGWRNAAWGLTLSRSETASIKDYAAAAGMCATIAKKAAGFAVACGVWASYLQVQAATANRLSPKGCLHVVIAPLPGAISHTRC